MQPRQIDVCVVGGGLSGLAVACAMRTAGASVAVIERRMDQGDPHRGDLLRPAGAALLHKWGVVLTSRNPVSVREIVVHLEGKPVARRRLPEAAPAIAVPHPQLEAAMRESARQLGVDVRVGWQLQSLTENPKGRITGITAVSSMDGVEFQAKLVVGADGRSSPVREHLGLRQKLVAGVHALLAVEADLPQGLHPPMNDVVIFRIGRAGGATAVAIGQRKMRIVLVMPLGEAETLSRLSPDDLSAALSRRDLLPAGSRIDSLRTRAYDLTGSSHALNYVYRGAVCVGDAVHIAPIPSGEGMQMSLYDADALARHVAPALEKGDKAIDKALDRFERERWPDNEQRLKRGRKAVSWLLPLRKGRLAFAKTPLAGVALAPLLAIK